MTQLVWTWWALPGILTFVVALATAFVVLRTAPGRLLNRRLAIVLFLEGMWMAGTAGLLFIVQSQDIAFALGTLGTAAMGALTLQYFAFLGISVQSPLARPFRSKRVVLAIDLATLVVVSIILTRPHAFLTEPYSPGWAPWNIRMQGVGEWALQVHGLASLYVLIAALSARRQTKKGTAARTRATWFAVAFGLRDVYVGGFGFLYPIFRPIPFWGDFLYNPMIGLDYLIFVVFLAYGVLRTQLFSIDLKLKFALQQGTVGAVVGGVFFVGSEALENVFKADNKLYAILNAAIIVLLLRPVERLAERLVNRLMPGVQNTPAYVGTRKADVYRAALEGAAEDGVITDRERAILAHLAEQLELTGEEVEQLEDELGAIVPALNRNLRNQLTAQGQPTIHHRGTEF
jgi:hypothetical protein